jgi:urocanate reductase
VRLAETVRLWNRYCDAGHDPDFGRTLMMEPIADPPFYAVELAPSMLYTQGGAAAQ